MQNKLYIFLAFGLLTGLWACVAEPDYPNEPQIAYESVSTTYQQLTNGLGSAVITISFTDGDGNLGGKEVENATCTEYCTYTNASSCYNDKAWSCFIIDSRDSCYQTIQLPDLTPEGNVKAISGNIQLTEVFLNEKPYPSPNPTDTVFYYIVIRDRSGNYSNVVRTEDIVLVH